MLVFNNDGSVKEPYFTVEGKFLKGPNGFEHDLTMQIDRLAVGSFMSAEYLLGPAVDHYCRFANISWQDIRDEIQELDSFRPEVDANIPVWAEEKGFFVDKDGYLQKKEEV